MSIETLILLLFAFLTVIAYMIAMNARGIWRLTLSFLLATCMLGGTVWVIILQYSTIAKVTEQADRSRREAENEERLQNREQELLQKEQLMTNAARAQHLIAQAKVFADMLQRERLQETDEQSHGQLVSRATNTGEQVNALQNEINSYRQVLTKFPDAAKLLEDAMNELKEACRLYRAYYFAVSAENEQASERQMRQKAKSAQEMLEKAQKLAGSDEK
jgi:DNA repair ATPase RecN